MERRQGVERAQNRHKQSDGEQLHEHVEQAGEYPPQQQEVNDSDGNDGDCQLQACPRDVAHHHAQLVQHGGKAVFHMGQQNGDARRRRLNGGLPLRRDTQDAHAQVHAEVVNPKANAAPVFEALQQCRRDRKVDELFYQVLRVFGLAEQHFAQTVNNPKREQIRQQRFQFRRYGVEERLRERKRFLVERVECGAGIAGKVSHGASP